MAGVLDLCVEGARRGDPAGCRRFVRVHQAAVFSVISRVLGPHAHRALVEDLAQESFLRALKALPRFDSEGSASVKSWLLTIATRRALSELGKAQYKHPPAVHWDASIGAHPGQDSSHALHIRHELLAAIAELTAEQRAVFVLRDAQGFSLAEIAEVLELPVSAVKSRLHRARARLRALLQEDKLR